jgi:hypothetical protein
LIKMKLFFNRFHCPRCWGTAAYMATLAQFIPIQCIT